LHFLHVHHVYHVHHVSLDHHLDHHHDRPDFVKFLHLAC
jgi:hypothetical protein